MDLHGIVSGAINVVNPFVPVQLQVSTGYTTNDEGRQVPSYADAVTVQAQIQALTYRDIQQIEGLNLQGTRRAIYLHGRVDGLVRDTRQGGDLITMADGTTWLVAMVLEQWPDWVKVAVTLQNSPAA